MKIIHVSTIAGFLLLFCFNAMAERFVVTGKPVQILSHVGYYTFPGNYITRGPYHFITVNNLQRVCFLRKMPEFSSLNVQQIMLESGGVKLPWNCYVFDPRFFEIDF